MEPKYSPNKEEATRLSMDTKSVLAQLNSNIDQLRSEAGYIKDIAMTQEGPALPPEPKMKEKVLDFRAQNRTFNTTQEIRDQRYNFSKSVIQEFEDEFNAKRELRETARERHYEYYQEKPPSEHDESDHECPYPLWVSPNLRKVPPPKRNPTVPEPFAFTLKPKLILPNTRQRKLLEMLKEKHMKEIAETVVPPFQAKEVPPECKIPLYDHMLAE